MSSHPFSKPSVSGTNITVDTYLKQPTRITKILEDLTLERFVSEEIFSRGGTVQGGAVIYDEITANDLYLDSDVAEAAPSTELPRLQGSVNAPKIAQVKLYGGEIEIADEARRRNDQRAFARDITRLSNTIVRKINSHAIASLDAALAVHTGQATTLTALSLEGWDTLAGHAGQTIGWSSEAPDASGAADPSLTVLTKVKRPDALFKAAQLQADIQELGVVYDTLLLHPLQEASLATIYGKDLKDVLEAAGLNIVKSNRISDGTCYFVARQQVGAMMLEEPLQTKVYREDRQRRDVVQSYVVPVFYVDNPTAVLKVTGLDG